MSNPAAASTRYAVGTFTPQPERSTVAKMVLSQARIEALLFLRHGEQQLLSLIIPLVMLVAFTKLPLLDHGNPIDVVFPFALAMAGMSAGFTGQAIAVAFDRRYGALKRIGASGVPPWTIIFGKVVAVLAVAAVQTVLLGCVALLLGWRATPAGVLFGLLTLIVGIAAFTAIGLLLGGTMPSEVVLALGNLIWFLLLGAAGYVMFRSDGDPSIGLQLIPSVALSHGMQLGFTGGFPGLQIAILIGWLVVAGVAANRTFRFTA